MFADEMNEYVTQYGRNTTLYGWKHDVYPIWQECYSVWLEHYVSEMCVEVMCQSCVHYLNYHRVAIQSVQQGLDPAGNNYLTQFT